MNTLVSALGLTLFQPREFQVKRMSNTYSFEILPKLNFHKDYPVVFK